MDWRKRAATLRTKKSELAAIEKEQQRMFAKHELSKTEYWKTCVKTQEDVKTYYKLYYPEYPDELVTALAVRLEELRSGAVDTTKYLKDNCAGKESMKWDYQEDVRAEKLKGQVALAEKRIAELLADTE